MAYAYDGNGNCIRKSGEKYQNEYTYDRMNRLVAAVQDGQEEKYAYDPANRQVGIVSTETDSITEKLCQTNRYDGEGLRYETEENGKVICFLFDRGELAQEKQEDGEISYVRGHHPVSLSRSGKDRNYFV